jgi:3-oxoacyl-[acyl-carrier-protein] synthase-1
VSSERCRPFDRARHGIHHRRRPRGFALLERERATGALARGYGESAMRDHMSPPHPEGVGARARMQDALSRAADAAPSIDYINLHGTASRRTTRSKRARRDLFPSRNVRELDKGWTGSHARRSRHRRAAISPALLESGLFAGHAQHEHSIRACGRRFVAKNEQRRGATRAEFSFGFGGSNCVAGARPRSIHMSRCRR